MLLSSLITFLKKKCDVLINIIGKFMIVMDWVDEKE